MDMSVKLYVDWVMAEYLQDSRGFVMYVVYMLRAIHITFIFIHFLVWKLLKGAN